MKPYRWKLENPSPNSWKKHIDLPPPVESVESVKVSELLKAVQLDAFGRRDRGSLDTKRHPQVQQTLMDRLAKALGVEARFHQKLEREGGTYEKNTWQPADFWMLFVVIWCLLDTQWMVLAAMGIIL